MSANLPSNRVPWTRRLTRRWRGLAGAPWEYCRNFRLKSVLARMGFVRSVWGLGWSGRICLLLIAALTVASAGVIGKSGVSPGAGTGDGNLTLAALQVALVGLVWSAGCAAAAALPLWGFGIAAFWLAYHSLVLMAPWVGTPVMPLPVWWLLVVALAIGSRRGSGRGWPAFAVWLGLCFGAGYFTAGPLGLNKWFHWTTGSQPWIGRLLLASVYAAAWRLRPWLRRHRWTEPTFGRVLAGSVVVMGLGLSASCVRDFEQTRSWAVEVMNLCGYSAALAWFWLAGAFAVSLLKAAEWGTRQVVRGVTLRGVRWVFPMVWTVVTVTEWLASHSSALPLMERIGPGRLDHWLASWPWEVRLAAWGHTWAGVVALVTGAGFLWQGREGVRLLPRLNALWAAAFFSILAVSSVLAVWLSPAPDKTAAGWWPALLLLGGMVWDLAGVEKEWDRQSESRLHAQLGWMILMLGILLALETRNEVPWATRQGMVALLGMLHLALPRALYHWWTRGRKSGGALPVTTQIWLTAAGMISILPILHHNSLDPGVLAFAPILWLPVLLGLRWRRPALTASSGALAGALLGSGTVAAWSRPGLLLPEVPIFAFLNAPPSISASVEAVAARPFLNSTHFSLLLLLTTTGAVLGAMLFRQRPPMGEIPVAIGESAA